MATASIENVKKSVETEVQEDVIQLTLSKGEASALYALTGLVWSGDGSDTYAREARGVRTALLTTRQLGYIYNAEYFEVDDDGDVRAKAHKPADK